MNKIMLYGWVALAIFSCTDQQNQESVMSPNTNELLLNDQQIAQLGVQTAAIIVDTISTETIIPGLLQIAPNSSKLMSFPINVKIVELNVVEGQDVSMGQPIAWLSDMAIIQMQEDYLKLKMKLELLEMEFKRQEGLLSNKATSDKIFQDTRNQFYTSQAEFSATEQRLKLLNIPLPSKTMEIQSQVAIHAPISGKITKCFVQEGQYLSTGQSILEISDTRHLWVDATLYQNQAASFSNTLDVVIEDRNQWKVKGKILHRTDAISSDDQANHLWIELDRTPHDWIPGMPVDCHFPLLATTVIALEKEAVVQYENKPYIFIEVSPRKFELKPVTVLQEDETKMYLANMPGEKFPVVCKGAYYLLMALKNSGV
jgi:cobalt-zinc-cadmium efflux system membrane fusion protein